MNDKVVVPPSLPTNTPAWLNNLIKVLLVAVPIVLAIWQPNGNFSSATAQAWIITGGVLLAGLLHIVEYIVTNIRQHGLSIATITATESEAAAYIKANLPDFQAAWQNVEHVLASVPTHGPAINSLTERLTTVEHQIANTQVPTPDQVQALVQTTVAQNPPPTEEQIRGVVGDEIQRILTAKVAKPEEPKVD